MRLRLLRLRITKTPPRKTRDSWRICWLGCHDLERAAWSWSRIPLSTPLEGVLDHVCTSHQLVRTRGGPRARRGGCGEAKYQLIGLGGLVALSAGTAVEAGMALKKARVED